MRYYGHRFEQLDKEREREYNEKHLADCKEVKTYKLSPEEIEARYGKCTGSGKYIDSLVDVRNLTRKDDEDMPALLKTKEETIGAVKALMELKGIEDHLPTASVIAKNLKSYEPTIYKVFGGVDGLAEAIGVPSYAAYKKMLKERDSVGIRPIEDMPEEEFEKVYVKAHPEPLVFTVTSEDKPVRCPLFAEYQKKVDECMGLEIEIIGLWNQREDKQAQLLKLENWLEGFEAAAKLAGVSLE